LAPNWGVWIGLPVTVGVRRRLCTNHHQTRQPVTADGKVSDTLHDSPVTATAEGGGAGQIVASKVQTYLQLVDCVQDSGEARAGTTATSPDQF